MHANSKIELLAPVGKWSVLLEVINAGADAVYLGGKRFNMRLLRPDFNFSDQEIRDAVNMCHDNGVRLYVTANSLYYEKELPELVDYLEFLKDAQVDAVIVQDLALIDICRGLGIALHASVQMGVDNLETVRVLEQSGVSRVILSKNLSLEEIREIKSKSNLGLEYFVHGDLCIAHAGQCLMSGLLFAESGNRGRCRKPCRWPYDLEGTNSGKIIENKYILAHKDLCLYHSVPELIDAGVTSFKIEGRMREAEYLTFLVSTYRGVIDKYLEGIVPTVDDPEWKELYECRIRDFTTGNLYRPSAACDIGFSGEREPVFLTSPRKLARLHKENYQEWSGNKQQASLSVKVGHRDGLKVALDKGVQTIIIPGTFFHHEEGFSALGDIALAIQEGTRAGSKMVLEFPRIVTLNDHHLVKGLWDVAQINEVEAVIVHDPGLLDQASQLGIKAWAGYGLNINNTRAVEQVKNWGAVRACTSLEIIETEFSHVTKAASLPLDVMVHGPLCGIISDFCVMGNADKDQGCTSPCKDECFYLVDTLGQKYPVESDHQCRCYIYHPFELSLFTKLPWLAERVSSVRIEGQRYSMELLRQVIEIYQSGLKDISKGRWDQQLNYCRLLELFPAGLTQGPLGLPTNG